MCTRGPVNRWLVVKRILCSSLNTASRVEKNEKVASIGVFDTFNIDEFDPEEVDPELFRRRSSAMSDVSVLHRTLKQG